MTADAAWFPKSAIARLSPQEKRAIPSICPVFVIEVMSPGEALPDALIRMEDWIRNGVQLGWLIDPGTQSVHIYRANGENPESRKELQSIAGEGPLEGFVLDLTDLWEGP